jgi:sugar phosphate isomerase/epimerase
MTHPRLPFGAAAYSFPCGCGFLRREAGPALEQPLDAWRLIALARDHGLAGVELPLRGMLPDLDLATIDRLRAALADSGLGLVVDTGVVDVAELRAILPLAARAGAKLVRATLSTILEGSRAGMPGGWDAHLDEMRRRVAQIPPDLEAHDLALALENHQDATSDDLLALCEAGGERVGVTFDVVNPLAVGEEPFAFARKLGPRIRNVHLKDYHVFATSSGYRLVRCALGEGLIDWPAMLDLLREVAPGAPHHVELAALFARHIRLLEDDWWAGFPPRDAHELVPALRLLSRIARPDSAPWQSPWEQGLPAADVARWEMEQFERSVSYLRALRAS